MSSDSLSPAPPKGLGTSSTSPSTSASSPTSPKVGTVGVRTNKPYGMGLQGVGPAGQLGVFQISTTNQQRNDPNAVGNSTERADTPTDGSNPTLATEEKKRHGAYSTTTHHSYKGGEGGSDNNTANNSAFGGHEKHHHSSNNNGPHHRHFDANAFDNFGGLNGGGGRGGRGGRGGGGRGGHRYLDHTGNNVFSPMMMGTNTNNFRHHHNNNMNNSGFGFGFGGQEFAGGYSRGGAYYPANFNNNSSWGYQQQPRNNTTTKKKNTQSEEAGAADGSSKPASTKRPNNANHTYTSGSYSPMAHMMMMMVDSDNGGGGSSNGAGSAHSPASSLLPTPPTPPTNIAGMRTATTILRIRGLPYAVTRDEIEAFVKDYPIDMSPATRFGRDSILIITKGGARGEGYVRFKDADTAEKALHSLHKCTIGDRYVELYDSSAEEMRDAAEHQEAVMANANPIVRVRGLPFTATVAQLRGFFDNIAEEDILDITLCYSNDGKLTGDAFVEFSGKAALEEAHKRHNSPLGTRYLEIINSNQHEKEVILHAARGKKSAVMQQQRRANKAAAAAAAATQAAGGDEEAAAEAAAAAAQASINKSNAAAAAAAARGRGGRGAGAAFGRGSAGRGGFNDFLGAGPFMGGGANNGGANAFTAMLEQMTSAMLSSPQMMAMMGMAAGAAMANSNFSGFGNFMNGGAAAGGGRGGRGGGAFGATHKGSFNNANGPQSGRSTGRGRGRGGRGGYQHEESGVNEIDDEKPRKQEKEPFNDDSTNADADKPTSTAASDKKAKPINPLTGKPSLFDVPWDAPVDTPQDSASDNGGLMEVVAAAAAAAAANNNGAAPSALNADDGEEEETDATAEKKAQKNEKKKQLARGNNNNVAYQQGSHPPPNFPAFNPMLSMMSMMNPQMMMAFMHQLGGMGGMHPAAMGMSAMGPTPNRTPSQWAVRVRGLPFTANEGAVGAFFSDVNIAPQGVHMAFSADDRPTGEAYVEVMTKADMEKALRHSGKTMGKRYIEVFPSSGDDIVRLGGGVPAEMFA